MISTTMPTQTSMTFQGGGLQKLGSKVKKAGAFATKSRCGRVLTEGAPKNLAWGMLNYLAYRATGELPNAAQLFVTRLGLDTAAMIGKAVLLKEIKKPPAKQMNKMLSENPFNSVVCMSKFVQNATDTLNDTKISK